MVVFYKYLRAHKKTLIWALILATINQVFSLLDPQIFRLLIDNYATKVDELTRNEFFTGVGILLGAFIVVALISRIAKNMQDYYVNNITQRVGAKMYADGIQHLFKLPYQVFEDHQSGEVLQKLLKAKNDTQNVIDVLINVGFLSLVGILFVVIYSFFVHWSIALAFILIIPLLGITMSILSKKIGQAQQAIARRTGDLSGSTTETLRNVELVKSLGLEEQELARLSNVNEELLVLELKKVVLIRRLSFIQGTLINGVRAALMFLMLVLLYNSHMTIGEFFTILFYSFFIFSPLSRISELVSRYQEAKASGIVFEELLKQRVTSKPKKQKNIGPLKTLAYHDVNFRYESQERSSLNNISLTINKGETVAFVGPSGSGKTTMIKLLLGLYEPQQGGVYLNNTPLLQVQDFYKKVGFVAQETQLFAGTIRENLLFVNPAATDKEFLAALTNASAQSIISRAHTSNPLDERIGEGGIKLSGGERQRLAIARALLRNPELLIFDEATSSLDSITEKEITNTITRLSVNQKNRMTILVAHRLSTVMHADTIYVFEKGRIIEKGSHEELLRNKGLYAALWRGQSGNLK